MPSTAFALGANPRWLVGSSQAEIGPLHSFTPRGNFPLDSVRTVSPGASCATSPPGTEPALGVTSHRAHSVCGRLHGRPPVGAHPPLGVPAAAEDQGGRSMALLNLKPPFAPHGAGALSPLETGFRVHSPPFCPVVGSKHPQAQFVSTWTVVLTQELVIGVIRPSHDARIGSTGRARSTCLDQPCIPWGWPGLRTKWTGI